MTSNLEEKWFFKIDEPCPHSEVVYFLSIFSALYAFIVLVVTGELLQGLAKIIMSDLNRLLTT